MGPKKAVNQSVGKAKSVPEAQGPAMSVPEHLKKQEEFAAVLSGFITCPPSKISAYISYTLEYIGKLSGADNCFMYLFNSSKVPLAEFYEWDRTGQKRWAWLDGSKHRPVYKWVERIMLGSEIVFESLKDIPGPEKEEADQCRKNNIASAVILPVRLFGKVLGYFGISTSRPVTWTDRVLAMIRITSGFMANAVKRRHDEIVIQENERKYHSLFSNSQDSVFLIDVDTAGIQDANQVASRTFGYTIDELKTMKLPDISTEPDKMLANLKNAVQTVQLRNYQTKDGSIIPVEINLSYFKEGQRNMAFVNIRAIGELKTEREILRNLFDNINALIYVVDAETDEILFINEPVQRAFGNIIGQPCWKGIEGEIAGHCADCPRKRFGKDLGGRQTCRWEYFNKKTGKWFDCFDAMLRWFDGRLAHMHLAYDISVRKQLEQELLRSRHELLRAQTTARMGNWSYDVLERRLKWAEEIYRILGLDPNKAAITLKEHKNHYFPQDYPVIHKCMRDCIYFGEPFSCDVRMLRPDGSIRYVQITGEPEYGPDGRVDRIFGAAQDVTGQKLLEEDLREAKNRAERADNAKSMLVANISHEIRTPVNSIMGFIQLVLGTNLQADQRDWLETAHESAMHLISVINEVLDYSRMEAGRLSIDEYEFDFNLALSRIIKMFEQQARYKGLELKLQMDASVPRYIVGDRRRVGQILINLISNALKFTEKGSVTVSVSASKSFDATLLNFRVRDTGIGMTPEELDKVFGRFEQASWEIGKKYGGYGLGLSISKQLAEAMGGTLTAESRPSAGSVFTFACPFKMPLSQHGEGAEYIAEAPGEYVVSPGRELKVLLAEDNPAGRKLMEILLARLGHKVTSAENGLQAVELFKAGDFDVVFLDIEMPQMNGFDACKDIRNTEKGKNAVVIALTAHVISDEKEKQLFQHMDGYLSKPVSSKDLEDKIAALVHAKDEGLPPGV